MASIYLKQTPSDSYENDCKFIANGGILNPVKLHERFKEQFSKVKNVPMRDALIGIDTIDFEDPSYGIFSPNQTIFVGKNTGLPDIFGVFARFRVSQFVQIDRPDYLNSLYLGAAILKRPGRFLKMPYPVLFPNLSSSQVPSPTPPRIFEATFKHYNDRNEVLANLESFLELEPATLQHLDSVVLIIDEMMKNSLWANIDEDGRRIYSPEVNSISDPTMNPQHPGRLFVIHDTERLMVGCRDDYGSLEPTGFIDLLNQTFDPYLQDDIAHRGYGLGFKNMIDHSSDLIVVSRRNVQTFVCCGIRLGIPSRKHLSLPKNIHFHFF